MVCWHLPRSRAKTLRRMACQSLGSSALRRECFHAGIGAPPETQQGAPCHVSGAPRMDGGLFQSTPPGIRTPHGRFWRPPSTPTGGHKVTRPSRLSRVYRLSRETHPLPRAFLQRARPRVCRRPRACGLARDSRARRRDSRRSRSRLSRPDVMSRRIRRSRV